jgi:peptidoglycan hydrolase CwlO-like protein
MDKDQRIEQLKAEIKSLKEEIRVLKHRADLAQVKAKYREGIRRRHQR